MKTQEENQRITYTEVLDKSTHHSVTSCPSLEDAEVAASEKKNELGNDYHVFFASITDEVGNTRDGYQVRSNEDFIPHEFYDASTELY